MNTKFYTKKKPLVVALSLVLLGVSQTGDAQNISITINDGQTHQLSDKLNGQIVGYDASITNGTLLNSNLRYNTNIAASGQHAVSQDNNYWNNSSLEQNDGSNSARDKFHNDSEHIFNAGQSSNNQYYDNSGQYMNSKRALSRSSEFHDYSVQEVIRGATSELSIFHDNSLQGVSDGGTSHNARFTGNAEQIINDGSSATDTTFSGNASQILEDGAQSENTTFNDNASGIVGANAQMTGNTTLNGNSVLTVFAQSNFHGGGSKQLENVTLNNSSRLQLLPTGSESHEVQADTITMNDGSIAFGHEAGAEYTTFLTNEVKGSGGNLIMNGDLAGHNNDRLNVEGNMSGKYNIHLNNQDSGKELPAGALNDLIVVNGNNNATFTLDGGADQGTHKVIVDTKKDPKTGKTVVVLVTDTSQTSRTTDAVMGLASATQYIFDGEMQALRTRRGDIQRFDQGEGGVWGRYLHNSTDITAGAGSDYRLGQNGMEIGGDKVFDVAEGKLSVGALTSYSKSSVKQRGDSSPVASYGAGLYSTWMSPAGYYVDGVIKYNRFSSDLRTHTDRGQLVKGSYDQNGYGAALETGYQLTLGDGINVDPYVRASYFAAQGKDMALSNGMKADIGTQKSAKGELGVSVGKAVEVRSVTLSPYVTAAVEHEFLKDNTVTFNDRYTYKNDQSGTLGKFGAGMTAQVSKNAQVFVEADYRKGNKVESPIMANAGFRVNF